MTDTAPDLTLDELRAALAPIVPRHAAFDGWSVAALDAAGAELGLPPGRAGLAFPGGAVDMIDAWFAHVDQAMVDRLGRDRLAAMKIRERITALVVQRLELVDRDREALRRALTILAKPSNAARGARLAWRAADAMWRAAGDTAADFAHYSKRTTLAAVYGSTLLVFLDDETDDFAETRAFLARRIENVMQFEKLKARLKPDADRMFSPARFFGRLRYPVR
ncbi:ubiquinone biosynthesis protein COQ9 [Sphingomonas laterariae]|uniref:Ubiquinone biosynthesis protein COQ9 n=1 Tax=Edaphosphingomonas laterariae TaxID=861865 RepID=A0A239F5Q0_9SPHN|nr:COQ9 family protein [Sphingomonas laterariae]SNS52147.1 ubiquinone biosynthesis protein COQ9 [Sphingomonas laterariae]